MKTPQEIALHEQYREFKNKIEQDPQVNPGDSSLDLASELQSIEPKITTSPWPNYEHVRGYGLMVLPFSSGHLLGLRVWPQNDFAPYISVWHCTQEGEWSTYIDGPSLEITCPRYWGPALKHAELTDIHLVWTSPNELRVEIEKPRLVWTMSMEAPSLLRKMNKISSILPLWTWKPAPLLRIRERMAKRFFDMGRLRFSFVTPSGHDTIIMPERMFLIKSSNAVWKGHTLGESVRLEENPKIGEFLLPTRPTFAIGQVLMRIKDRKEYRQTRKRVLLENESSTLVDPIKDL